MVCSLIESAGSQNRECSYPATASRARRLCEKSLPLITSRSVIGPTYPRSGTIGVVHLGLGAFHRAHQALVFDRLLASGDARWGVLGVAMRNPALADALARQDGLYSVQLASATDRRWHIGGALWHTCIATTQRHRVVQALAAASTRWVTLTVTEKAYGPPLAELLLEGLAARHAGGLGGLTLASCDNLPGNGNQLRDVCLRQAAVRDPGLQAWIQGRCAFPNSMVDRIVPAGSAATCTQAADVLGVDDDAALRTEVFWEWVIERRFVDNSDALALAAAGVQVVDDVRDFEDAKLRLLNGSHSALACIGALAGLPLVSDCIAQPAVHRLVHGLMTHEVAPLLQRRDWADYRDALLQRFANPHLEHSVHQIATDSSIKIALRWVPAALHALEQGLPVTRLAFCAAAWMRYCLGVDESGRPYGLSDPLAQQLQALARADAADAVKSFDTLGNLPQVWGRVLPRHAAWRSQVVAQFEAIRLQGVLAAAAALPHGPPLARAA